LLAKVEDILVSPFTSQTPHPPLRGTLFPRERVMEWTG
jgi:hypothetical protein